MAILFGLAPLGCMVSASDGTVSLPLAKRIRRGDSLEPPKGVYRRKADVDSTVQDSLADIQTWTVGGSYYISRMTIHRSDRMSTDAAQSRLGRLLRTSQPFSILAVPTFTSTPPRQARVKT